MPKIKLQSSDGKIFVTDMQILKCSTTIQNMLENCNITEEDVDVIVPLRKINSEILKMVLAWAEHNKDTPEPQTLKEVVISEWDAEFLDVDQGILFDLIVAANYLDMKGLLSVTTQSVANMIKGKTPEEMRKTFHIQNDFLPEEEREVREENQWCEDHLE